MANEKHNHQNPLSLSPEAVEGKEAPSWLPVLAGIALIIALRLSVVHHEWLIEKLALLYSYGGADFELFILAGFVAQMIDGALGMAYGVSASTFLLTIGVPPAAASASIHTSEIFTSGVSGLMHLKFQNVNKKLFRTLLLPGVIGAAAGALTLSYLEQYNNILKPLITIYTLYLGVRIIQKAFGKNRSKIRTRHIPKLASFGGFMDSVGGGGWGPIVSSTLIAGGRHPRYTIGSVNLTEFFVALASSITFFSIIGISYWNVIAGLILGGIIAAPLAAFAARKIPTKKMMLVVGTLIILISARIIFITMFH